MMSDDAARQRRRVSCSMANATHLPRAYVTALASPHFVELLMPLYPQVPRPRDVRTAVAMYAVSLVPNGDQVVQLAFPELSLPDKMLTVNVACVASACNGVSKPTHVCRLVELLQHFVAMSELRVLRMTAKYVLVRVPSRTAQPDDSTWLATLQLSLALHERAMHSAVASDLRVFDFALSHMQAGLMAARCRRDGSRRMDTVERAHSSDCHVIGCDLHREEPSVDDPLRRRSRLQQVFQQLMAHDRQEAPTPSAKKRKRSLDPQQFQPASLTIDPVAVSIVTEPADLSAAEPLHMTDLTMPVLHALIHMLTARDVAALSGVCTRFQHVAYEVVPGLYLQLFNHQRRALRWLLHREGSSIGQHQRIPHPFVFPSLVPATVDDADPEASAIDLINGRIVPQQACPPVAETRGGLFCDEPGLGKTITMLALILRTKGQRSNPRDVLDEDPAASRTTRVSSRLAAHGREVQTQNLLPSAATLIIVPRPLLDHWRVQIATHVAPKVLRVWLDELDSTSALPPPASLASFDVVITSFERLSTHWKHHKPRSASELNRPRKYGFEDAPEFFIDGYANRGTSPLLRVHWVRIVVDEGHVLGGKRTTNHLCMAELLHASKRWVMTGTPTPSLAAIDDLRHLYGLLRFLRERPFGDPDDTTWRTAIAQPFHANDRDAYVRLQRLLQRIMLRHTKASVLQQIPEPTRHVVVVDPTPSEWAATNGIVAAIRVNLVTNQNDPRGGPVNPNSLLHATNHVHARTAVRNLRNATCGGGSVRVTLAATSVRDTIALLTAHGVTAEHVARVTAVLQHASGRDRVYQCPRCPRRLHILMLLPCGHFVCPDCVEARVENACGVCHTAFEWPHVQALQPGVELSIEEALWSYDGHVLLERRTKNQGIDRKKWAQEKARRKALKLKPTKAPFVPIDHTRFSTVSSSKTFYVAYRIGELMDTFETARAQARHNGRHDGDHDSPASAVLKVLVFSQLREHTYRLKVTLEQHGIVSEDFVAGISAAAQTAALVAFRTNPDRHVLLLSDAGSLGLDLSFVTHIFFMEEILDRSLEHQVVARAHRMGARGSVVVEKLLMRGSLEAYLHNARSSAPACEPVLEEREALTRLLLRNVRLMDETIMAPFGFLRFAVRTEDGQVVRADTVRLPNPGTPPSVGGKPINVNDEVATDSEAAAAATLADMSRGTDEALTVPHVTPSIVVVTPEPIASATKVVVVDLTEETSDTGDDEGNAMHVDDSETDDEWNDRPHDASKQGATHDADESVRLLRE